MVVIADVHFSFRTNREDNAQDCHAGDGPPRSRLAASREDDPPAI
jgi:hypothetical protein